MRKCLFIRGSDDDGFLLTVFVVAVQFVSVPFYVRLDLQ